jgi:glycosyltransferase involved in cell wall biosynthesis
MSNKPLVSVVIPTFRRLKQLKRAVHSVLSQDYQNFEVIVVDDDLVDADNQCLKLINAIGDNRVKCVKNSRTKGGNGARNTGVLLAKGEYVAFLDDDDEWYSNKLSLQIEKMDRLDSQWGAIYSGHDLIRGNVIVTICSEIEGTVQEQYLLKKFTIGASSTLLFRKEVLLRIGLWNEQLVRRQDVELVIRLLRFYKLAVISHPLVCVNGHNNPNPHKMLDADIKLNRLIIEDINKLPFFKRNIFYALQYHGIGRCFAKEGYLLQAIRYTFLSLFYGNFNIILHAKVWFFIIKNFLKVVHLDDLLKEDFFMNKYTIKSSHIKKGK